MSNSRIACTMSVIVGVVVTAMTGRASLAQDPVKVAADNYKVALENEIVRVINVTVKAGEKITMHAHPDHVAYHITGGKVKFTSLDGKSKEIEHKAGEAVFSKAETHQPEFVGSGELKVVIFELKKPAGSAKPKAPEGDDQIKAAADVSKVIFENERVRLIEHKLKAGGKMAKHSHPAHVSYSLGAAKLKLTVGDKTEERSMTPGKAVWSEPVTHTVENVGTSEGHGLVLELKD